MFLVACFKTVVMSISIPYVCSQKDDSTRKPMTRQRAQALAAGHPKRKTTKDDKPVRPRGKRGTVGSVLIESPVDKDCPSTSAEPKQKKPRTGAKKLKNAKEEPIPPKLVVEPPQEPPRVESPVRLPFKKRITIRNEIEEFVNQRRQVSRQSSGSAVDLAMPQPGVGDRLIGMIPCPMSSSAPKRMAACQIVLAKY